MENPTAWRVEMQTYIILPTPDVATCRRRRRR